LGAEGIAIAKLARGEGSRPLVPTDPPLPFEEATELEHPLEMLEPLAFVLNRMLESLCARLQARGAGKRMSCGCGMALENRDAVFSRFHPESGRTLTPGAKSETAQVLSTRAKTALARMTFTKNYLRSIRLPVPHAGRKSVFEAAAA